MATVGENQDAHTGFELAPDLIKLVVDELAIVENPGFVHAAVVFLVFSCQENLPDSLCGSSTLASVSGF